TLFCTKLWAIEGRMRFTQSTESRDIYKSMSLLTYVDLVLSDENVDRLAEEFRTQLPAANATKYLKAQVRVEAPRNTEIIELAFDTPDPDFGIALVNRMMQMHIDYTNEMRRTTMLRQSMGMLRNTIEKCDAQVRKWQTTIDEY